MEVPPRNRSSLFDPDFALGLTYFIPPFVKRPLRERYKDKPIIIAGDDDHRLENNPGREKAIEAAAAVKGLAVFPKLSTEQREQGMTDFNDLGRVQPEIVARHLEAVVHEVRQGRAVRREHAPSMELTR